MTALQSIQPSAYLVATVLALCAVAYTAPAIGDEKPDLASWRQADLYDGWSARDMLDVPVQGVDGKEIGEVENILVRADGTISKVVVEVGGFLDIGDRHVGVPWVKVQFGPEMAYVSVPIEEKNADEFSLFRDEGGVQTGPREWRVTELIHDFVSLEDVERYALVTDLVFDRSGALQAVLVQRAPTYGPSGPYASPYYGPRYGYDPGRAGYDVPHTRKEIEALGPFDYDKLELRPRRATGS